MRLRDGGSGRAILRALSSAFLVAAVLPAGLGEAGAPEGAAGAGVRLAEDSERERVEPPSGMVRVDGGRAWIGTTSERAVRLGAGRGPEQRLALAFETPRHEVALEPYAVDEGEVTNAQYHVFLEDAAATGHRTPSPPEDLRSVVSAILRLGGERASDDAVRQAYERNREALWAAMPERVAKDAGGSVDEAATRDGFLRVRLKPGIDLRFWRRQPPANWSGAGPEARDRNLPVSYVSYEDAAAFAEWAGKHVPTEAEWEHAARGPEEREFPWGDDWLAHETRANWGGAGIVDERRLPRLVPADDPAFEGGRSWCGARHMLGNVAEWTSSWFRPYPGGGAAHDLAGTYVKVIRGACAADMDALLLRLAARNYAGGGPALRPLPVNRFDLVGFRCAWYPKPGRDAAEHALARLVPRKGEDRTAEDFAREEAAGASSTRFAPAGSPVVDGIHVLGRARAVVAVPRRALAGLPAKASWKDLAGRSASSPIVVAAFHSDVPLKGAGATGTFLLAVSDGRACLLAPDGGMAGWLSGALSKDAARIEEGSGPDADLRLDVAKDSGSVEVSVPLGPAEKRRLRLRLPLSFEPGALAAAGL